MDALGLHDRRMAFRVDLEAWRHPGVAWESEDLVDMASMAATCDLPSRLVRSSLDRMISRERVRSWAVVMIDADGGLRRDPQDAPDVGIFARAVTWIWSSESAPNDAGGGAVCVDVWQEGLTVDAVACLPLARDGVVSGVIAVWLTADDIDAVMRDVSRLTILRRLWAGADDWSERPGESGAQPSAATARELTPRQSVILRAMARGRTNAQIAHQISFSESTVRLESMSIYRHFGVHSRSDAVQAARDVGEL